MATAQELITDAWVDAGVGAVGDAMSAEDAQSYLRRLNRMLDSWNTELLSVYELYTVTLTTIAGTRSYSSSSLSSTTRPINVESAIITASGIDYTLNLIGQESYQKIAYKTDSGLPRDLYEQPGMANATYWFYPTPDAAYTVTLSVRRALPTTLTLSTSISLPPGYNRAIVDSLAVEIMALNGMQPNPVLIKAAQDAKANIQRLNEDVPVLNEHLSLERPNIFRGF